MASTPGGEHRRNGGVKLVKMGISEKRSKYFDEKSLYIHGKYLGGYGNRLSSHRTIAK